MSYIVGNTYKFTREDFIKLAKQGMVVKHTNYDTFFLYNPEYVNQCPTDHETKYPGIILSDCPNGSTYIDHINGYFDAIKHGVILVKPPLLKAYNKGLS